MAIPSELNSFRPEVRAGQLALTTGSEQNIINVMFQPSSATYNTLNAGDVVSFAAGKNPLPIVKSAKEVATDGKIGIVLIAQKKDEYSSGDMLEIATNNTDVYMIASGSIARGDKVKDGTTSGLVITTTDTNYVGIALDAADDGEFVRIRVRGI